MSDISQKLAILVDVKNAEAKRALDDLTTSTTKYSKALTDAQSQGKKFGSALQSQLIISNKSFGQLIEQSQKATKATSLLSKEFVSAATKLGLIALATRELGASFNRVFDPKKVQEWVSVFRSGMDSAISFAISRVEDLADRLGRLVYGVTGDTSTTRGAIETNAKDNARRQWEAMGRRFVNRTEAYYRGETATEDLLDYQTLEQSYRQSGTARMARGAGASPMRFFREQQAIANQYGWARGGGGGGGGAGPPSFIGGALTSVTGWGRSLPGTGQQVYNAFGGMGSRLAGFFGGPAAPDTAGAGQNFIGGAAQGGGGAQFEQNIAQLNDQTSAIGASLAAITGGLQAAVDAAISGHASIGRAALAGAAAVLKSIALQATGYAAFELALAWVDPLLSAKHLTAAAKMAAVAAGTGVLAASAGALAGGGGGGGYGGGAAPGPGSTYVAGGRGSGGGGGDTIIVNVNGFVGADVDQAIAVISKGLEKAEASRRTRSPTARVTRYEAA